MSNDAVIRLMCTFSPGPGMEWHTEIWAEASGRTTKVYLYVENVYETPKLLSSTADETPYSALLHVLLGDVREVGIDVDVVPYATAEGDCEPWACSFLLFSWGDTENSASIGHELADLSMVELKALWEQEGGFNSAEFIEKIKKIMALREGLEIPEKRVGSLLKQYKEQGKPLSVTRLLQRLEMEELKIEEEIEREEQIRRTQLAPYQKLIDQLCAQHRKLLAKTGGLGGAIGRQILAGRFRRDLEDYALKNGKMPEGEITQDGFNSTA